MVVHQSYANADRFTAHEIHYKAHARVGFLFLLNTRQQEGPT